MRRLTLIISSLLLPLSVLSAREWKNTTGDKSFEATYLSNDGKQVTLRRGANILTFSIAKLHSEDQAWLKENHPPQTETAGPENGSKGPAPKGAAFDTLEFGDSNKVVLEKLLASPMLECTVAESMLARTGINGSFRTKQAIGGLHSHLYFDWDDKLRLREVTLRSKPKGPSHYSSQLKKNWSELINLLTILHGDSVQDSPYPKTEDLQDGLVLGSHLWRSEDGHSVLLGTGQEGDEYSVIVRITSDRIKTNPINQ